MKFNNKNRTTLEILIFFISFEEEFVSMTFPSDFSFFLSRWKWLNKKENLPLFYLVSTKGFGFYGLAICLGDFCWLIRDEGLVFGLHECFSGFRDKFVFVLMCNLQGRVTKHEFVFLMWKIICPTTRYMYNYKVLGLGENYKLLYMLFDETVKKVLSLTGM